MGGRMTTQELIIDINTCADCGGIGHNTDYLCLDHQPTICSCPGEPTPGPTKGWSDGECVRCYRLIIK